MSISTFHCLEVLKLPLGTPGSSKEVTLGEPWGVQKRNATTTTSTQQDNRPTTQTLTIKHTLKKSKPTHTPRRRPSKLVKQEGAFPACPGFTSSIVTPAHMEKRYLSGPQGGTVL